MANNLLKALFEMAPLFVNTKEPEVKKLDLTKDEDYKEFISDLDKVKESVNNNALFKSIIGTDSLFKEIETLVKTYHDTHKDYEEDNKCECKCECQDKENKACETKSECKCSNENENPKCSCGLNEDVVLNSIKDRISRRVVDMSEEPPRPSTQVSQKTFDRINDLVNEYIDEYIEPYYNGEERDLHNMCDAMTEFGCWIVNHK